VIGADGPGMERATWSREQLCDLVRGKEICLRNPVGGTEPVPDWLAAAAGAVIAADSAEYLELTHPDDQLALVEKFFAAQVRPGELFPLRLLWNRDGRWQHMDGTWLNLCDQDDVRALLYFAVVGEGPEVLPPVAEKRGEHESTSWMVLTVGGDAIVNSVEGRVTEMLGYRTEDVIGERLTNLLSRDSLTDGVAMWQEMLQAPGSTNTSRRPWVRKDGTEIWLESSYLNLGDRGSGVVILAVVWDITERIAQEQALRQSEADLRVLADDFQLLADEVPSAVFRCDAHGAVAFHNARWTELLHGGEGVARLHDIVSDEDGTVLDTALAEMDKTSGAERRSLELQARDGLTVWRLNLRSMGEAARGGTRSFVGSIDDVTATVRLRREARRDPLTGLLNRPAIEDRLAAALAEDAGGVVVVFLDLDGFKGVNDTYGHESGDVVLQEVARRLALGVRPDDAVGRYGGDEFIIVCTRAASADPQAITARLEIALAGPIDFETGSWTPRASIGTARPEPGEELTSTIHRADMAMFDVKRQRPQERRSSL
jgi:diguanylate cyclase (GGDEF)-like protein/PAS domain S-box-containing protein